MKQEERDKILISLKEKVDKIYEEQQEMKDDMTKMQGDMTKMQDDMTKLQGNMTKMQGNMTKMQGDMIKMQDELTRLGNTVTLIEYEHGRKIDIILDVLIGHIDKFEEYEKRFGKDEKILEKYGHQIYGIEQKLEAI